MPLDDGELIKEYFSTMAKTQTDFTDSFQALNNFILQDSTDERVKDVLLEQLVSRSASPSEFASMLQRKMKVHRLGMHPDQIEQLIELIEKNPDQVGLRISHYIV